MLTPGAARPTVPMRMASGGLSVVTPHPSVCPYASMIGMPTRANHERRSGEMGAAADAKTRAWSSPSWARIRRPSTTSRSACSARPARRLPNSTRRRIGAALRGLGEVALPDAAHDALAGARAS